MEMKKENDLADEFKRFVDSKRYLIVLKGVHTIEEWDSVKVFFSNSKKGSRIIVSTEQVEVASLCVRQRSAAAEHKQLHMDHALYAFYEKVLFFCTNILCVVLHYLLQVQLLQ
jgi:hypothetical protein